MGNRRIQRVSELAKQQISEIVQGLNLTNCGFVTVTAAEISPDLKEGRVFVSVIGTPEQQQRALHLLAAEHGRIQNLLARRVILKYTPHLTFLLDETEAKAREMEQLLDQLGEPDQP